MLGTPARTTATSFWARSRISLVGASSARYHQPRRVSTSTSVSCLLHYPFPSPLRRPAVPAPSPKSLPPCTSLQSKRYSTAAADDDGTAGADLVNLARRTLKRKRLALRDDVSSANTHAKEVLQLRKEAGELGKLLDEYDAADKLYKETQHLLTDPDLSSLASSELPSLLSTLRSLQHQLKRTLLSYDPAPHSAIALAPILVEFTQGEGGDDSCLWNLVLRGMYQREWARLGWKWNVLSESWIKITGSKIGSEGLRYCLMEVWDPKAGTREEGEEEEVGVYGRWRWETGVHRLQEISEADKAGRMMTSAGVVYVIPTGPLVENEGDEDVLGDSKDIRIDVLRSSGPGGQHANKTESAVRIVHIPTGISASCQESRSQHENKRQAFRILRSRLLDLRRRARQDEIAAKRKSQLKGWGKADRIRTYNRQAGMCREHRVSFSLALAQVEFSGDGFEWIHRALEQDETERRLRDLFETEDRYEEETAEAAAKVAGEEEERKRKKVESEGKG